MTGSGDDWKTAPMVMTIAREPSYLKCTKCGNQDRILFGESKWCVSCLCWDNHDQFMAMLEFILAGKKEENGSGQGKEVPD